MTLRLNGIGKTFNGIPAAVRVNLELRGGESHALLGENGAGKSTLIKVMAGVHKPTTGTITLDGETVEFDGPLSAVERGVSVVHQERNIVPDFSVAENVFLNRLPKKRGFVDYKALNENARHWLGLVGLDLDVRREASELSPGQGQLLEIARALSRQSGILLLDEPTASIGEDEVNRLFELLQSLKESGKALLFVSHKLEEVYRFCNRVTVIRDGHVVIEGAELSTVNQGALIEAMVGRKFVSSEFPPRHLKGDTALELRDLGTTFGHRNANLSVSCGEIVGLYGLVGAGRTELARSVVGLEKVTGGQVLINGHKVEIKSPAQALKRYGIGYVSEDRKGEGLIVSDTIERNASMAIWDKVAGPLGLVSTRRTRPAIAPTLDRLGVKMASLTQPVSDLSGGNQQKVSVAKWIAADAHILIFDEPTVGIDVGAKDEMHMLLWGLADSGKTIFMISSDLREVVQLSDRILVMAGGELCADIINNHSYDDTSQRIMNIIVNHNRQDPSEPSVDGPFA